MATVNNIDWPSRPGLGTDEQKAELLALLDRAVELRLNAIIFQVRTSCDALYLSSYEPWSEYLTGQMGQAPKPIYDPLALAVAEAHKRGLELHAWFNPFRARHSSGRSRSAPNHIVRTHPHLARHYGSQLWLDPGEPAVQTHTVRVIMDVVRRYDVDGVHLDDYFYPYPEKTADGKILDFPDTTSFTNYARTGGRLARKDWRRQNVDTFIQRLYRAIKTEKPHVKFGISPFGIWRPGFPAGIRGLDAYDQIYGDSRKWLAEGWLDYCSPQLYWPIDRKEQAFGPLLKWWAQQNPRHRHLWPGIAVNTIGPKWPVRETQNQLALTRQEPGASGNIFWSIKALRENRGGLATTLAKETYAQSALIPATPWLDAQPPAQPHLGFSRGGAVRAQWQAGDGERPWLWLLQTRRAGRWISEILPGGFNSRILAHPLPDGVSIRAIDRCGNASVPMVVEKRSTPAKRN